MKKIVRTLSAACACALAVAAGAARAQPSTYTYTPISRVMEANVRVAALAIDAGRPLQMSWKLERAFSVSAELAPLKSYAGDVIGNSAAAKAPRTITRAYTSAKPEIGSPSEGRYVIVEMDPEDFNASSWYMGFNPGIRQILPYKDAMSYEVRLLHELNFAAPNASPTKPGAAVDTLKTDAVFKPGPGRIATADGFSQAVFEMPENASIKFLAYNLHKPADVPAGRKVPLVVFLHGSGQSHDYAAFPNDPRADVLSPLLANQGGTTWVENAREKAFVLVPQAPARDTRDGDNEGGWRSADTQKMLLALVDKLVAENPSIDVDRLYLTGLSMGAMGSWKILNSPDPKISRKFAAAALIAGIPKDVFFPARTETPAQRAARIRGELDAVDLRHVTTPLWIAHANTDPVVDRLGARVPFAKLTGKAKIDPRGDIVAARGVLVADNGLARDYRARNRHGGADVRYVEYQFDGGDRFRDLGMVTRHGHFSWEAAYKDRALIDWMFAQRRTSRR